MYKTEPKSTFFLLEYLTDVDPTGRVLPDLMVAQMADLEEPIGQSVLEWSALAGHYRFNSLAWRQIAIASCRTIGKLTKRERNAMYVSLCPQGVPSSQFKVGEMDPQYLSDLDQRQRELDSETTDELKHFRRWRLDMAQEEYDRAVAEFNAEHKD